MKVAKDLMFSGWMEKRMGASAGCGADVEPVHDLVASAFEKIDDHGESVKTSIVGIGNIPPVLHSRKVTEQVEFGLKNRIGAEHLVDHFHIGPIHCENVVKTLHIGCLNLAGGADTEVSAVGERLPHPVVRLFSRMVGYCAGRITIEVG